MFEFDNQLSRSYSSQVSSTAPRLSNRTTFAASDAVDHGRVAVDQTASTERADSRPATSTPFAVISADPIDYSI